MSRPLQIDQIRVNVSGSDFVLSRIDSSRKEEEMSERNIKGGIIGIVVLLGVIALIIAVINKPSLLLLPFVLIPILIAGILALGAILIPIAIGIVILLVIFGGIYWLVIEPFRKAQPIEESVIEEEPKELKETEKKERTKYYHSSVVDSLIGGGWLPRYNRAVGIVPRPLRPSGHISFITDYLSAPEYEEYLQNVRTRTINLNHFCCFNIILGEDFTLNEMRHFWNGLQGVRNRLVFEIIGDRDQIVFQFLCHFDDKPMVAHALSSMLPSVNSNGDDIDHLSKFRGRYEAHGVSFGLKQFYGNPLNTTFPANSDPLTPFLGVYSDLQDETIVLQALVSPAKEWNSHTKVINDNIIAARKKQSWCPDFQKEADLKTKIKTSLFAVSLKAAVMAKHNLSPNRTTSQLENVENSLLVFNSPVSNSLSAYPLDISSFAGIGDPYGILSIPDVADPGLDNKELQGMLERNTYRHGFILNANELATVLHFPSKHLQHPRLLRQRADRRDIPAEFTITAEDEISIRRRRTLKGKLK